MNKQIFITNGMARSGKDTFAMFLDELVPTIKYSSIDEVKNIARRCGWKGGKSEKDRKFLSDLKCLLSDYNDLPFKTLKTTVDMFHINNFYYEVLLIDIREPKEIERAKKEFNAKTILISNDNVKKITSNEADAGVFDYKYDYIIENNGTLEDFKMATKSFYNNIIKQNRE